MIEQYIIDMAMYGTNNIALVAPDGDPSPVFTLQPPEMTVVISQICAKYDLGVSVWAPYSTDKNWNDVFLKMPRLDELFVPAGDPGSLDPQPLFWFLEQQASAIRK